MMKSENNIIQEIEALLQDYIANPTKITDISLRFKQTILIKLNQHSFNLIKEEINYLFNQYQSPNYTEIIACFKILIEEFINPNQITLVSETLGETVKNVSYYNTEGQKVDNLTLEELKIEKLIDGRYQLIKQIGSGGMGVVWKALDKLQEEALTSEDQRYVAIKFIDSQLNNDMFANSVREANRTRTLKHNNIVSILNIGKLGGLLFIVMELLKGITLKEFIAEKVKQNHQQNSFIMPYEQALHLSRQITEAMAYAHTSDEHKNGILHLDLKPENIFYNPDNGVIKIFDFGLARYVKKEDDDKTIFNGNRGLTIKYASLEALERYDVDNESPYSRILDAEIRDDVYSLACIVYEIFSGKKPNGSLDAKQAHEANKQPPALKLKPGQWQALAKALAFKRKDRTLNLDIFLEGFFKTNIYKKPFLFVSISKLIIAVFLMGYFIVLLMNRSNQESLVEQPPQILKPIITIPTPEIISPAILKFWTVVNNKKRKVTEINKNSLTRVENFKIGDKFKLSFLANEDIYIVLVYINSHLNKKIALLDKCCYENETYIFPKKHFLTIDDAIGTDKIRILVSKYEIQKQWIRLNNSEIDEKYIRDKLMRKFNKKNILFINGKLDLVISQ